MGCFPPTSDPPQGIPATSPTATQYEGSLAHRLGVWLSASAVGSPTALLGASKVRPSNPHPCLCTTEGMSLGDSGGQLHIGRRQLSLKADFFLYVDLLKPTFPKLFYCLLPVPVIKAHLQEAPELPTVLKLLYTRYESPRTVWSDYLSQSRKCNHCAFSSELSRSRGHAGVPVPRCELWSVSSRQCGMHSFL